jgi:hypothetical protein
MALVILNTTIENADSIKGMSRKWPGIIRASLQAVALWWFTNVFPRHFTPGNEVRYHHEPRNPFYKKVIKRMEGEGQGRYVDDLLKGKSLRWMLMSATITGTQHVATLRMKPPAYFTDPKTGRVEKQIQDETYDPRLNVMGLGRIRTIIINITRQPDKVREVTQFSATDKNDQQAHLESDMTMRMRIATVGRGVVKLWR